MLLIKTTLGQENHTPYKALDLLFNPTLLHILVHDFKCSAMKGKLGCCDSSGAVIYSCFWRLIQKCFCWTMHHQASLNILIRTPQDLGIVQAQASCTHMYILGSNPSLNPQVSGL